MLNAFEPGMLVGIAAIFTVCLVTLRVIELNRRNNG